MRELKGILPPERKFPDITRRLKFVQRRRPTTSTLPDYGRVFEQLNGDTAEDPHAIRCWYALQSVLHERREAPFYGPWQMYLDFAFETAQPAVWEGRFIIHPQYPLVQGLDSSQVQGSLELSSRTLTAAEQHGKAGRHQAGSHTDETSMGDEEDEHVELGEGEEEDGEDDEGSEDGIYVAAGSQGDDGDGDGENGGDGEDDEDGEDEEGDDNEAEERNEGGNGTRDEEDWEEGSSWPADAVEDVTSPRFRSTRIPDHVAVFNRPRVHEDGRNVWGIGHIVLIVEVKPPPDSSASTLPIQHHISRIDGQTTGQAQHAFADPRRRPSLLGIISAAGVYWSYRELYQRDLPKTPTLLEEARDPDWAPSHAESEGLPATCSSVAELSSKKVMRLKVPDFLKELCDESCGYFELGTAKSTQALVRIAKHLKDENKNVLA